jgi:hypothetical protein
MFEIVQFEEVNDSVDIGKLFFTRSFTALTEKGGELESFANRAVGLVNIELFAITCRPLEGNR